MTKVKFDPKKLSKLNNPDRLKTLNPDLIWDTLELQNPKILIDIGAGTGFFAKEFSKKLDNGKIYACDSSDVMLQWMQENITDKNIIPLKCSESSVELPNEIADLIYMLNVHHELLEPEALLAEAFRLLKFGGKIAIIDWKPEEMQEGPPLETRLSEEIVIEQLEKTPFRNITKHKFLPQHWFIVGEK